MDSDTFGEIKAEVDKNPRYTAAYSMLRKRKDQFFLTMNDGLLEEVDKESADEDEA